MLVVTFTTQRSGSKFLGRCFMGGTVVSPFGEVFNPDVALAGSFHTFVAAQDRAEFKKSGKQFMDEYFGTMKAIRGVPHVDIMFNQLEIPCFTWNPYEFFFMYGYFREARAVVISLERDIFETYVSSKYLELAGGPAHNYERADHAPKVARNLVLDPEEYRSYRRRILWHRARLEEAMQGYEYYYRLDYAELAKSRRVPEDLSDLIVCMAKEHRVKVNGKMMQIEEPNIYPSNVNYGEAFMNYNEVKEIGN